jgi:glycosyltransferase involved in cell wall biosynthesis
MGFTTLTDRTATQWRAAEFANTVPYGPRVLIACPDSRPPAYQAVIGLNRFGLLDQFLTGFYYPAEHRIAGLIRRVAPRRYGRHERILRKRFHPEIPSDRVCTTWSFDLALAIENRVSVLRRSLARWRTRQFDHWLMRRIERTRPDVVFIFSDVGSEFTLPRCRELGIPTVLSVVHGDVNEEIEVLERESCRAPEFMPIYLGDGCLDRNELNWLHDRRRNDAYWADRILVPSDHLASAYERQGTGRDRLRVIPYAADLQRFTPATNKEHNSSCTFLFAGGITQRKGIGYLLQAWQRLRRPGWRLQLLGALPSHFAPLTDYLDGVEWLGRVPHGEVPALMASADVFVFPSLFEGSAVVTYEALACGLPSIVTPAAGSVVRDGIEGLIIPPGDVDALALAMADLGSSPDRRAMMARSARQRAEEFSWERYHAALVAVVTELDRSLA